MPTFALNFSRPGSEVIAQYFMFVSWARRVTAPCSKASSVAQHLSREIAAIGPYRLITDGSELPVFAFTVAPEVKNYTVFDVSARLREQGWLVPAYTFPENRRGPRGAASRGARRHVTRDMADLFLEGLRKQTGWLESLSGPLPQRPPEDASAFKH